ncbi:MAG: transposase [Cyanobium sp.]
MAVAPPEADMAALLRKAELRKPELSTAELIHAQKDELHGKDRWGDELPQELQRRLERIEAIRGARAELEAAPAADQFRRRQQQAQTAEQVTAEVETPQATPRPELSKPPGSGTTDYRKIRSKAGRAIHTLRKSIVEPVFAQTKGARGLDCFLLRGLDQVNGEWHLIAITPNGCTMPRAVLARA